MPKIPCQIKSPFSFRMSCHTVGYEKVNLELTETLRFRFLVSGKILFIFHFGFVKLFDL